jgi:CBS domain-containing protein
MSTNPKTLKLNSTIEEAVRLFAEADLGLVPVVDDANKVLGIITLSDLTKFYGVSLKSANREREIDRSVDAFMQNFEKQFVLVTKFRTKTWLLVSLLFAIVGFIIATALVIRISISG